MPTETNVRDDVNTASTSQALGDFAATIGGPVFAPDTDGYDAARKVWNGMIDRRPAAIVRCRTTQDVVGAVRFATRENLPIAVRGGGHNAAGLAVADGALVVDLSEMRDVTVDPVAKTATVSGGATWADVDRATSAHGLATTGGGVSMTGVGGLTLGGGLGWLMRSYGLTADNLLAAEVVTAAGEVVTATAGENPDLFWALRGGGGNFGVVTSFTFRLHEVSMVLGGMVIHPLPAAKDALRFFRDFCATAPDELTVFAALMTPPGGMPCLALAICYNGPIEEGERVVAPLRQFGPPVADLIQPAPYVGIQTALDEAFPEGLPVYWRSHFLKGLDDASIDTIVDSFMASPSPASIVLIEQLGGAMSRVDRDATAFEHRDAAFNIAIITRWPVPELADPCIAWARAFWDDLRPASTGVYVNYLGVGEDRVRDAYSPEKYARLQAVKRAYDAGNTFRFNQNIAPD